MFLRVASYETRCGLDLITFLVAMLQASARIANTTSVEKRRDSGAVVGLNCVYQRLEF